MSRFIDILFYFVVAVATAHAAVHDRVALTILGCTLLLAESLRDIEVKVGRRA